MSVVAPPGAGSWAGAWADLADGFGRWRAWLLLARHDVATRYRRARLGQFWITLAMGAFVGGVGLVYGTLFGLAMADYLPHLAAAMVAWTFLSTVLLDGGQAMLQGAPLLRQQRLPVSLFALRGLARNAIVLAHNAVLLPLVFLATGHGVGPVALLALPGLAVAAVAAGLWSLALGLVCARFRDVQQILQNVLQILFFLSPVTWTLQQIGTHADLVLALNPLACLLTLVVDPLMGRTPPPLAWAGAVGFTLAGALAALALLARARARLVYWL
jgi:lipopolysaccharide transport system permease protein